MGETENLEDVGYLQDIISYVFDEKKIVTYKWISNILSIHVNRAKQLLYTFIKYISKERLKELKITYLVGGILPDNRGCRLQVVSGEDLEKVKAQFKMITSEHIYSVSLTNCLTDLHNLYTVDGVKDSKIVRHGAVRCAKGVARTIQELASKRQEAHKTVDDEKKWPSAQSKQPEKPSAGNDKKSSKAGSSISAMFFAQNSKGKAEDSAASKKSEEVSKGDASSPEKKASAAKNSTKSGKPPPNRLAAMFSAQNAKPKPVKKDEQVDNASKMEKDTKNEKQDTPKNSNSDTKKATVTKVAKEKTSKNKGSKSDSKKTKQKKRKASDNREDKSKKRKRIVVMDDSDSSSDDVFGSDDDDHDEEEEEEEEEKSRLPTPPDEDEDMTEEPTKVADAKNKEQEQEVAMNGHRGRKRRLVDKTFQDEEGYIVTKKVYEFVSCSEDENEDEKKNEKSAELKVKKKEGEPSVKTTNEKQKSQKNPIQKKNSPPEKKKQATLMNFFKRS